MFTPETQQLMINSACLGRGLIPKTFSPAPINVFSGVESFASGLNGEGKLRGFAQKGLGLGVLATMSERNMNVCLQLGAERSNTIFVDSGAFGEMKVINGQLAWPQPITDNDWAEIFSSYERLAQVYGSRMLFVAPDRVGCQETTLERLKKYAEQVKAIAATGAVPIVVIQGGAKSLVDFYDEVKAAVGDIKFSVGIPCKKAATELDAFEELCKARGHEFKAIHLLGLGANAKKFNGFARAAKTYAPLARLTHDSVIHRAHVGWAAQRPMTTSGVIANQEFEPFYHDSEGSDETDEIMDFEANLKSDVRRDLALGYGYSQEVADDYADHYEGQDLPGVAEEVADMWREAVIKRTQVAREMRRINYGIKVVYKKGF